jgi:hypothetical protein
MGSEIALLKGIHKIRKEKRNPGRESGCLPGNQKPIQGCSIPSGNSQNPTGILKVFKEFRNPYRES